MANSVVDADGDSWVDDFRSETTEQTTCFTYRSHLTVNAVRFYPDVKNTKAEGYNRSPAQNKDSTSVQTHESCNTSALLDQ